MLVEMDDKKLITTYESYLSYPYHGKQSLVGTAGAAGKCKNALFC